jgi:hypothetical protein
MKTDLSNSELPEELRGFLNSVPEVSSEDLEKLNKAAEALETDPTFQADYLKSLFVEKMYEAMEELDENQNQLARRWGKTRQYVSKLFDEDKRVNFTIETMTELAHLLGCRLEMQILRPNELGHVLRTIPSERVLVRPEAAWLGEIVPQNKVESKVLEFSSANENLKPTGVTNHEPSLAA